ncbi:MAG: hypothetical protein LUD79_02360 [Oscillospiraceae bacterium]|nr:hypothetical protein [Oscillospiraceae bacterium]
MARRNREYADDDGRIIADMSGVSRPGMFGHLPSSLRKQADAPSEGSSSRPEGEEAPIPKEERKWYILGALKGALLIGLVYLVVIVLVILLMLLAWGQL